jgi:alkylhydroperoxidase/carboxymuconolactone decarboxylase family protein YurZ/quercetin dioxygenase-like cupin family protein
MIRFIAAMAVSFAFGSIHAGTCDNALSTKEQSVVTIAGFTANGDFNNLAKALHEGLDAGLTISEIKEVLLQLYAYAGFPRSLNALNTFMTVLKERQQKGIKDAPGKAPTPLPTNKPKLQFGTEIQTQLIGQPVKGEVYEFAPAVDQFLKEHLFGDIFGRGVLDFKTREIATIAALASLGGAENQLRSHFRVGMHNGLTEAQLIQLVSIIQLRVGHTVGNAASIVLQTVLPPGRVTLSPVKLREAPDTVFSKGARITNTNFTGNAWLETLVGNDSIYKTQVGNVTFEPGARSKWHLHPGGQILLAIGGTGYYQEKGSSRRLLRKGDVVKCPPNTPHWHGASPDEPFIQVAITPTTNGQTVWLKPVTEEEYNSDIKP